MKILSHQEFEYLKGEKKFGEGYERVIRHRLRKKVKDMFLVIDLITRADETLLPKEYQPNENLKQSTGIDYALWGECIKKAETDEGKKLEERLWTHKQEKLQKLYEGGGVRWKRQYLASLGRCTKEEAEGHRAYLVLLFTLPVTPAR